MTALLRLWRISWRNIFRNRRRSALTLLVMVLGTSGLILVGGFFQSQTLQLGQAYIYGQSSHFLVNKKGFFNQGQIDPTTYLLEDYETLEKKIEREPHVKFTAPRLFSEGMLSNDTNSIAVMATGVIPSREARIYANLFSDGSAPVEVVEGQQLSPDDPYGILVGESLQKSLGLRVGDSVSFITQRKGGSIDGADFHVRGVFQTVIKEIGERSVKVNLQTLQEILNSPGEAHTIQVFLDETPLTDAVLNSLKPKLDATGKYLELIPWYAQGKIHDRTKKYLDSIYHTVQVIIGVIFFLSIANTINMALLERMKEYGTMMAMGNRRYTIFQMILLETFFLGLVGSVLGVAAGFVLSDILSNLGIHLMPSPLVSEGLQFTTLAIQPAPFLLVEAFGLTLFASIISALFPAYRAAHTPIIEALGYA